MDPFELKVKTFIEQHQLLNKGDKTLVGVSGGPDSLALLYFLKRIRNMWDLSLMVAHVDHMFRGEESFSEMKYVQELCESWNIPFKGKRINVPQEVKIQPGSNPQNLSRKLRYDFFRTVMEKEEIPLLALAHHGDDQIETILMRLTRGTSVKGAAGIRVKRTFASGAIIRPFLCVTKQEIEEYTERMGLKPVYDPSNKKDTYTRNRFRKSVLPFLKQENAKVHTHFQRFSEELFADNDYLYSLAEREIKKFLRIGEQGEISFPIERFLSLPSPLQRRGIHLILNYLYKGKDLEQITGTHVESILHILYSPHPSKKVNLPEGLVAERSYSKITFHFHPETMVERFSFEWEKGGEVLLPNGNKLIMKKYTGKEKGNDIFFLDESTPMPLVVRTRKEGDRIEALGMSGSKKIKSLFIDRKIPIKYRNEWPIVTDREGRILWVPLLQKSKYEADPELGNLLVLQYIIQEDFWEDLNS